MPGTYIYIHRQFVVKYLPSKPCILKQTLLTHQCITVPDWHFEKMSKLNKVGQVRISEKVEKVPTEVTLYDCPNYYHWKGILYLHIIKTKVSSKHNLKNSTFFWSSDTSPKEFLWSSYSVSPYSVSPSPVIKQLWMKLLLHCEREAVLDQPDFTSHHTRNHITLHFPEQSAGNEKSFGFFW